MPSQGFQSDQYLSRSWKMLTKEQGWTKPVIVLAFAMFIPIVGPFTLLGYAHEWARLTAWGVDAVPKQRKVDIGTCVSSGGRAFVVSLVWSPLILLLNVLISVFITNDQLRTFLGYAIDVIFATLISVAILRATIYKRLRAGLNFARVFELVGRDFQGVLRIMGITLMFTFISILLTVIMTTIVLFVGAIASAGALFSLRGATMANLSTDEAMYAVLRLMQSIGPLFPLVLFVIFVVAVLGTLVVTNALGLWMRQFNVEQWGASSDPLPQTFVTNAQTVQTGSANFIQDVAVSSDSPDTYVYAPAIHQQELLAEDMGPIRPADEADLGDGLNVPDPALDPIPGTHAPDAHDLAASVLDVENSSIPSESLGDRPAAVIDDAQTGPAKAQLHDPLPEAEPVSPTEELPLIKEEDVVDNPVLTTLSPLETSSQTEQDASVSATAILVDDEPVHVVPEDELEAIALEQAAISHDVSAENTQQTGAFEPADPDTKEALESLNPNTAAETTEIDQTKNHEVLEDGSIVVPLIPLESSDSPEVSEPLISSEQRSSEFEQGTSELL